MRAKETSASLTLTQEGWEKYRKEELKGVLPIITKLGFVLDEEQVQTGGERYLMSGHKLVLIGHRIRDGKRVVIKVSSYPDGIGDIERERNARMTLNILDFALRTFFSPEEILFTSEGLYVISITAFVEQDRPFLTRPLSEQFFLALRAFETQEGVHATTSSHAATIKEIFGLVTADDYLHSFKEFQESTATYDPSNAELKEVMMRAWEFLSSHRTTIERYCGFLTHHDLSLHNFRVVGHDIHLLDHTSIYFGNKYEGWARFLNFMTQYNPALEKMLQEYVRQNRGEEEYLSLRLMRVFKLGLLLQFHTHALSKTSGNLAAITRLRVTFWTEALAAILADSTLSEARVTLFVEQQEALRSEDEKKRNEEALRTHE